MELPRGWREGLAGRVIDQQTFSCCSDWLEGLFHLKQFSLDITHTVYFKELGMNLEDKAKNIVTFTGRDQCINHTGSLIKYKGQWVLMAPALRSLSTLMYFRPTTLQHTLRGQRDVIECFPSIFFFFFLQCSAPSKTETTARLHSHSPWFLGFILIPSVIKQGRLHRTVISFLKQKTASLNFPLVKKKTP